MKDFAISPTDGDLVIKGNEMAVVDGSDAYLQNLRSRLRFIKGEHFLDVEAGVDYYGSILVKGPNVPDIDNLLKVEIIETESTKEILSFDSLFDNKLRKLQVKFRVNSEFGEVEFRESIFPI